MGELHHECGVAAVYHAAGRSVSSLAPVPGDVDSVALLVPRMLLDMQNRGQLAAGMASYRPDRNALIKIHKEVGTVAEAFRLNHREEFEAIMRQVDGPVAIGHVRYATCGGNERNDAQPFERDHGRKAKWFAFAFNGQLANYEELKEELLAKGDYHLKRDTDTEIIMHSLAYELQSEEQEPDWVGVFGRLAERFDGAYNIVLITAHGELVVARDPLGFRPLCIAEHGPLFASGQRECPTGQSRLSQHPVARSRNVGRGQSQRGAHRAVRPVAPPGALFLRVDLFRQCRQHARRPIGLPEPCGPGQGAGPPGRCAVGRRYDRCPGAGYGQGRGRRDGLLAGDSLVEGLMRNRYMGRTFIEGTADRTAKARLKYTPLPEVLAGKRVLLVEDSIVRSTTMRALVHEIRDRGGAREIHLRVACPPIIAPCFYGIDMSRKSELFASPFVDMPDGTVSEEAQKRMAKELGADSLRYLPVEAIARSVSLSPDRLCRACITGHYPT